MIKLGDTVSVKYGESTTAMWLVKDMNLKKYTNKYYVVMGFVPGKGWYTANSGSLAEMRRFIKSNMLGGE